MAKSVKSFNEQSNRLDTALYKTTFTFYIMSLSKTKVNAYCNTIIIIVRANTSIE